MPAEKLPSSTMQVLDSLRATICTKLADALEVYGSHSASSATTLADSRASLWHTVVIHSLALSCAQNVEDGLILLTEQTAGLAHLSRKGLGNL